VLCPQNQLPGGTWCCAYYISNLVVTVGVSTQCSSDLEVPVGVSTISVTCWCVYNISNLLVCLLNQ
jgi:hypothetical protein